MAWRLQSNGHLQRRGGVDSLQVLQVQQVVHVVALELLAGGQDPARLARQLRRQQLPQAALARLLLLLAEAGHVDAQQLELLQVGLQHGLLELARLQLLLLLLEGLELVLLGGLEGGHHSVGLGLELAGRAGLGHRVGAVPQARRALQGQRLQAAHQGGLQHRGLLEHEELAERPAGGLPLRDVHRQHHLLRLRLFTLNLRGWRG